MIGAMSAREEHMYRCLRCGKTFTKEEMETLPGVRCPYCGYKIIVKLRPPIAKRVKAI